jgi:hypothetical protein
LELAAPYSDYSLLCQRSSVWANSLRDPNQAAIASKHIEGGEEMRRVVYFLLVLGLAPGLVQLKAAVYLEGRVGSMHSVSCGETKIHKGVAEVTCEEYTVRTDSMVYRIRQEVPKKVNLLPVGQEIYFRVQKNRMLVKGYTYEGKKINNQEYVVVSEHPRNGMAGPGGSP